MFKVYKAKNGNELVARDENQASAFEKIGLEFIEERETAEKVKTRASKSKAKKSK